jgi:hypothetical protein
MITYGAHLSMPESGAFRLDLNHRTGADEVQFIRVFEVAAGRSENAAGAPEIVRCGVDV